MIPHTFIDAVGHRGGMPPVEHLVERMINRCQNTICASCACCMHCDDCICPTGPCRNETCGCWIMDRQWEELHGTTR